MFGTSKTTSGLPRESERPKTEDLPQDIPPMPGTAMATPGFAQPKKAFNYAEKPKPAATTAAQDAAHLYIGANIRLKGEIAGCDLMRVEGIYEGTAKARQLVLCPGGSYLGTAEIEDAEVEGTFEGALHVRGQLYLRKQGRIRGTFSYGQLEIERGGEIDGRILPFDKNGGDTKPAASATVAKPAMAPSSPAPNLAQAPKPVEVTRPAAVAQAMTPAAPAARVAAMANPAARPLNGGSHPGPASPDR